jgi:hypothetical protein
VQICCDADHGFVESFNRSLAVPVIQCRPGV